MPYNNKSITTSNRSYEILRFISQFEEGSYSTEIAEELDMHQSSVSNIIRYLTEIGVLQKGERRKAQYYQVDKEGMEEPFSRIWSKQLNLPRTTESIQDFLSCIISVLEEKIEESEKEQRVYKAVKLRLELSKEEYERDLSKLVELYSYKYFDSYEESNLQKMLFDDFRSSLFRNSGEIPAFSVLGTLESATKIISEDSDSLLQISSDVKQKLLRDLLDISNVEIRGSDTGIVVKCEECEGALKKEGSEGKYAILKCECGDRVEKVPRSVMRRIPELKEPEEILSL